MDGFGKHHFAPQFLRGAAPATVRRPQNMQPKKSNVPKKQNFIPEETDARSPDIKMPVLDQPISEVRKPSSNQVTNRHGEDRPVTRGQQIRTNPIKSVDF